MTILLVDDEAMMRKLIRLTLQRRGFQVFDAANGFEGLALAEQHPMDVLLTDIVMGDIDGWTLARSLVERQPALPIVFTSGQPVDFEAESQGFARCTFLQKPFQPSELLKAISDVVCVPA